VRRAIIPGAGAIVNARSLARHYAMLAGGGALDGVRLLSRERVVVAGEPQPEEPGMIDVRWWTGHGLGYTLGGGPGPRNGLPHALGYEGVGTIGFADPSCGFAFAFLKNLLDMSSGEMDSATRVTEVTMEALGIAYATSDAGSKDRIIGRLKLFFAWTIRRHILFPVHRSRRCSVAAPADLHHAP